jgi:hypothetical protein
LSECSFCGPFVLVVGLDGFANVGLRALLLSDYELRHCRITSFALIRPTGLQVYRSTGRNWFASGFGDSP